MINKNPDLEASAAEVEFRLEERHQFSPRRRGSQKALAHVRWQVKPFSFSGEKKLRGGPVLCGEQHSLANLNGGGAQGIMGQYSA